MLTHRNLASNALDAGRALGLHARRRPAARAADLPRARTVRRLPLRAACRARGCCGSPKFDADEVRALLPRATVMMGVPTFYTRLLATPSFGAADCRSMRLFVSGSAPLLPETFDDFRRRDRAHDPRALRDDRDGHEHLESARRRTHRRHGRTAAAGRVGARRRRRRRTRARAAKSAASRSRARTCSPATGACRRRRARNSPPTATSAPATSASSCRTATCASSAAPRT